MSKQDDFKTYLLSVNMHNNVKQADSLFILARTSCIGSFTLRTWTLGAYPFLNNWVT